MNLGVLFLAFVGTWNVGRLRSALPTAGRTARVQAVLVGCAFTLAAVTAVAAAAASVADWLDLTPPTVRISVGVVAVIVGLRDLLTRAPSAEPGLGGAAAGIVPLFFPLMFSPVAGLLALSAGVDRGTGSTVGIAVLALVPLVAAAIAPATTEAKAVHAVERGVHRALAGVLVLAAVALIVDGIYDI